MSLWTSCYKWKHSHQLLFREVVWITCTTLCESAPELVIDLNATNILLSRILTEECLLQFVVFLMRHLSGLMHWYHIMLIDTVCPMRRQDPVLCGWLFVLRRCFIPTKLKENMYGHTCEGWCPSRSLPWHSTYPTMIIFAWGFLSSLHANFRLRPSVFTRDLFPRWSLLRWRKVGIHFGTRNRKSNQRRYYFPLRISMVVLRGNLATLAKQGSSMLRIQRGEQDLNGWARWRVIPLGDTLELGEVYWRNVEVTAASLPWWLSPTDWPTGDHLGRKPDSADR